MSPRRSSARRVRAMEAGGLRYRCRHAAAVAAKTDVSRPSQPCMTSASDDGFLRTARSISLDARQGADVTPHIPAFNGFNTAFMLICASLVMLMTPGLAFFYGGLVQRKNVLTIMIQSFMSLGWTTVLWYAFGYSMCFGPDWHGIVGDPTYYAFLHGVTLQTMFTGNDAGIPLIVHIAYQMMFAIITPALITGAFANRVTFKAYFLFLTAWLVLVYFPFVHMLWSPDGLFAKWGVLDCAGGIVVHASAGFAALASVLYVGRRSVLDNKPHNVPLIALGTGLLWFGWYGFNAGSELRVDPDRKSVV